MPQPDTETQQPTRHLPSIREMIELKRPNDVRVSPQGGKIAFCQHTVNWKNDRYERYCYVHDLARGATYQVNQSGSVSQMEWVDEDTLALLKEELKKDGKGQIWLYDHLIGEGFKVTDHKTGISYFKPFAEGFIYLAPDPDRQEKKPRKDKLGSITYFEHEESASALYYTNLAAVKTFREKEKAATEDGVKELIKPVVEVSKLLPKPLMIKDFILSPKEDIIYLNCQVRDDLVYYMDTSSFRIKLDAKAALAATMEHLKAKKDGKKSDPEKGKEQEKEDYSYLGEIQQLNLPRGASITALSPDGNTLLVSHQGRDNKMYTRSDVWVIEVEEALSAPDAQAFASKMRNISSALDRETFIHYWVEGGIYANCVDSTVMKIVRFEENGSFTFCDLGRIYNSGYFHISKTGRIGFIGAQATTFPEIYLAEQDGSPAQFKVRQITDYGAQAQEWEMGSIETIRWKSRDGVEIEGVLRKPTNFDPTKKYPLALVVHGGPTWFSEYSLFSLEDFYYYPVAQFINKDILILKPNYRGSTGRGQAFLELNKDNLGVGDLWDLESGVEYLDGLGYVDTTRVGCMGWSQGGYISAFVGSHSDKFKAVSVGAGVSDWYTYHISNDIPAFTVDYLSGSPFRNRQPYIKTAPISKLSEKSAPTLIQHGSNDQRVPISNATELYRGLKEMGVPVELFIFPGMGHPITNPRENYAVMHQNLSWFSHYLLGEELKLTEVE